VHRAHTLYKHTRKHSKDISKTLSRIYLASKLILLQLHIVGPAANMGLIDQGYFPLQNNRQITILNAFEDVSSRTALSYHYDLSPKRVYRSENASVTMRQYEKDKSKKHIESTGKLYEKLWLKIPLNLGDTINASSAAQSSIGQPTGGQLSNASAQPNEPDHEPEVDSSSLRIMLVYSSNS
jgi:hypothetical protein